MSLDFAVLEITKQKVDKRGRNIPTIIELANFENAGYKMMNYGLGFQENCTTKSYDAVSFLKCLDSMSEDLKKINDTGVDEYDEKSDLEKAIRELQRFIEKEHITKDSDRVFDIYIWY